MPRPSDSSDVAASKSLSYILRHGAEKEGLHMRSDGFIRLSGVLARPKLRGVDVEMVLRLVAENAKQRFELVWGYDPSPPPPKKQTGKGKSAQKARAPRGERDDPQAAAVTTTDYPKAEDKQVDHTEPSPGQVTAIGGQSADAAAVEDLALSLSSTAIDQPVELPLVLLPTPDSSHSVSSPSEVDGGSRHQDAGGNAEYFIRATQGHSLPVDAAAVLLPVTADQEGRTRVGEMVHGSRWELWETIYEQGLSRMTRQHIHLAPSLLLSPTNLIVPRPTSTLLIYLDLDALLQRGIEVYTSRNGVVLTPGDEEGKVGSWGWRKVERVEGALRQDGGDGRRTVVWTKEGGLIEGSKSPV